MRSRTAESTSVRCSLFVIFNWSKFNRIGLCSHLLYNTWFIIFYKYEWKFEQRYTELFLLMKMQALPSIGAKSHVESRRKKPTQFVVVNLHADPNSVPKIIVQVETEVLRADEYKGERYKNYTLFGILKSGFSCWKYIVWSVKNDILPANAVYL